MPGFEVLKKISAYDLNKMFSEATCESAKESFKRGISVIGIIDGKRVLVHPDGTYTPTDDQRI